jgi:hypothetical protein
MASMSLASGTRIVPRSAEIRSSATAMSSREVLPATPVWNNEGLLSTWLLNVARRMGELSYLPNGWDSYGASSLNKGAADLLFAVLVRLNSVIQSEPYISLTGEGGMVAEWESPQSALELIANPQEEVLVYYRDKITNRESEMPVFRCDRLDKWLWRASSTV